LNTRLRIPRIRTLVVDDEPLARSNLTVLLRLDSEIEIVAECGSGKKALAEIRTKKPELVFLDVQMPECDGFDVVEQLGNDLPAAVVFVTAYDQYALKAFEAGALDYLLKPFDNERFHRALGRAKERIRQSQELPGKADRFVIKGTGQVIFVNVADIDWIEAADYYACLHVRSKTHLLRRRMSDLERELDQAMFCRIHRSTIVNLNRIQGLEVNASGEYEVVLDTGTRLALSRGYRKQVHARLGISGSLCYRPRPAAFSRSKSNFLRPSPHRYPPSVPSVRTTRWQGTTMETGLVAQAWPTARIALGWPIELATSEYVRVAPMGIARSASQTRR